MQPDFSVVQAEFLGQLTTLDGLIQAIEICEGDDPNNAALVGGRTLPTLAADSRNVMAAAAIVAMAAYFEAFVRAQVEEYAAGVLSHFQNLNADSRTRLVDAFWKGGVLGLGRLKPKDDPQWATKAVAAMTGLQSFPIGVHAAAADAKMLSDHDNNMRYEVITEIVSRLGIKKLGEELRRHAGLRNILGVSSANDVTDACKQRLFAFQDLRNLIIHQISQNSGVGLTVYQGHKQFLVEFSNAFSNALANKYPQFEARALIGNANIVVN